jgi:hypothetical protein
MRLGAERWRHGLSAWHARAKTAIAKMAVFPEAVGNARASGHDPESSEFTTNSKRFCCHGSGSKPYKATKNFLKSLLDRGFTFHLLTN